MILRLIFLVLWIGLERLYVNGVSIPTIHPDNIFSNGPLSYRTLLVDQKTTSLYVGAKGHLYRLWLYNINDTGSSSLFTDRPLDTRREGREECLHMGNSESECDNWVRLMFLKSNGQLLICTSNAMKPQLRNLDGQNLMDTETPTTIIGICSPHDGLNTTAVYVEYGNPDDIPAIYSGIRTGLSLENHLIYRPPLIFNNKEIHSSLRTIYTDSKWLNEPHFVGSYSIDQYVYFFFREIAVETDGCGRTVYSRVARVCKNDLGGKNVLKQVWSSFVKARLNCSLSSPMPYYFDHIQSVYKVDSEADSYFYATFTTSEGPFMASAVCMFSLNHINQIFDNGVFLEQPTLSSLWVQTQPDQIPGTRPGTCVANSHSLSDAELHFAKSHLLMADAIPGGDPIVYRKDEIFTKMVVDQRDESNVVLFVQVHNRQKLLKVLHSRERGYSMHGRLLAEYQLPDGEKIHSLAILPNEYLFVALENKVAQYRLGQCPLHTDCASCASDPYCSWNIARSECFAQETVHSTAVGWITNSRSAEKCRNYVKTISKTIYSGDSLHLECPAANPKWRIDKIEFKKPTEHLFRTLEGGLVLLNATASHSGTYQCLSEAMPLIDYQVKVDDEECSQPKSIEQFRALQKEWCRKFENYRQNLSKWERWYENNSHCPRVPEEFKPSNNEKYAYI